MKIPIHITGRTPGSYLLGSREVEDRWNRDRLGRPYRYTVPVAVEVTVHQFHCLECQAPGVTTPVPTPGDRRWFVAAHRRCAAVRS